MLLGVAEGNGVGVVRKHTKNTPAAPMGPRPKLAVSLESTPDDEKGERLERPSDLR